MKAKNKKDNLKKIYSDLYVSTKIQTEDNKYKLICYHFQARETDGNGGQHGQAGGQWS